MKTVTSLFCGNCKRYNLYDEMTSIIHSRNIEIRIEQFDRSIERAIIGGTNEFDDISPYNNHLRPSLRRHSITRKGIR